MSEWISVEERLPEEKPYRLEFLIGCKSNGVVHEILYNSKTQKFVSIDKGNFELKNVTHWMPLPEPPEEK